jgi:hypothetical protein
MVCIRKIWTGLARAARKPLHATRKPSPNLRGRMPVRADHRLRADDKTIRAQSTILGVKRFFHCEIVRHFAYASGLPQNPVQIFRMAFIRKI